MANIINAWEVITNSPAGRDYPQKFICDAIPREEQAFGFECLGEDLYKYLLDNLTPYDAGTTVEWKPGTTYALNAVVIRHGCLYKSNGNGNVVDPANDIVNAWNPVEKFTVACANELWTEYLRQILSFRVYMSTLNFSTQQSGAGGLVVNSGDSAGRRGATKAEISDMKGTLQHQIEMHTKNMLRWLSSKKQDTTCPLPVAFALECGSLCPTPGKRNRRWAMKY